MKWGADVRFFNDRLGVDLTYYNALTSNQILSLPIAISTGYNQRVINGGEVRSQGFRGCGVGNARPDEPRSVERQRQFQPQPDHGGVAARRRPGR